MRFIIARLECDTDKAAAERIGFHPSTVATWAERHLIREAMTLIAQQAVSGARAILERNAVKAAMVKVAGLDEADDARLRQNVATEIIDRTLGKPKERLDIGGTDDPVRIVVEYADNKTDPADATRIAESDKK